jgi:hypothetical protein
MDIPMPIILFLVLVVPILGALGLVFGVRYLFRRVGYERLYDDGVVMTDNGIEYLGFLFSGIRKVSYSEIASVELVSPFWPGFVQLVFYYGFITRTIKRSLFGRVIVIRFRNPAPVASLFFFARNPEDFYDRLRSKIRHGDTVA